MDNEETDNDDIVEIKESYGVDNEEAEEIRDVADENGLDYDDAHMIWEEGGL